jgi:hypothetical protein
MVPPRHELLENLRLSGLARQHSGVVCGGVAFRHFFDGDFSVVIFVEDTKCLEDELPTPSADAPAKRVKKFLLSDRFASVGIDNVKKSSAIGNAQLKAELSKSLAKVRLRKLFLDHPIDMEQYAKRGHERVHPPFLAAALGNLRPKIIQDLLYFLTRCGSLWVGFVFDEIKYRFAKRPEGRSRVFNNIDAREKRFYLILRQLELESFLKDILEPVIVHFVVGGGRELPAYLYDKAAAFCGLCESLCLDTTPQSEENFIDSAV